MKGTNVEEGKKMLAESGLNFATADTMGEAADSRRRAGGGALNGRPARQEHPADRPGITGREGTFHAKAAAGVPHHGRRRRHARQGRHDARGLAGVQHRGRRGDGDRRQRLGDLRAAAVCRRRDHGGGRRRHRARGLHHRRHSGRRHAAGDDVSSRPPGNAADRSELPGHHLARARARPASSRPTSARKAASASSRRAAR